MSKIERKIHTIDAAGQSLGRIGSQVAILLRGKNKPEFQPNMDCGDIVEVNNIDQLAFTGKKIEQKQYYHYSGYPGGLKKTAAKDIYAKNPGELLKRAVKEMLPPVRFRTQMLKRLIIR